MDSEALQKAKSCLKLDMPIPPNAARTLVTAIEALQAENARLREALGLADAALRGANINMNVVERKIAAALQETGQC